MGRRSPELSDAQIAANIAWSGSIGEVGLGDAIALSEGQQVGDGCYISVE